MTSQESMFLVLYPEQALAVLVACSFFEHVEHFALPDPFFVLHISNFSRVFPHNVLELFESLG